MRKRNVISPEPGIQRWNVLGLKKKKKISRFHSFQCLLEWTSSVVYCTAVCLNNMRTHTCELKVRGIVRVSSRWCDFAACVCATPVSRWTQCVKTAEFPSFFQSCTDATQLLPEHTGQTDHEPLQFPCRYLTAERKRNQTDIDQTAGAFIFDFHIILDISLLLWSTLDLQVQPSLD